MTTKTTASEKIDDLARVTYMGRGDGIIGAGIMEVTLLSTGEQLDWYANGNDWECITQRIAPVKVGDTIAIQGRAYYRDNETTRRLRNVRYTNKGRTFRGMAFDSKMHEAIKAGKETI